MNDGTFLAGIFNSAPVCGLRPVRAARFDTLKVPNPINVTVSPLFRALVMFSMVASSARQASALVDPVALANASLSSPLFMSCSSIFLIAYIFAKSYQ